MLQASLESLGASVFVLMIVGVCCRIAWRMVRVIMAGLSGSGLVVDHQVCLLARNRRSYDAVLKVGRVVVKEYGHVLS